MPRSRKHEEVTETLPPTPPDDVQASEANSTETDPALEAGAGNEPDPLQALQSELATVRQELETNRAAYADFADVQRQAYERDRKQWENEIEGLRQQRKEAIANNDADAFDAADRKLGSTLPPQPPKTPVAPAVNPVIAGWISRNPWYGTHPEAQARMDFETRLLRQTRPDLDGNDLLNEAKRRVGNAIPEIMPKSAPEGARSPSGAAGASTAPNSRALRYADLPPDQQKAVDQMVRLGIAKSADEYMALVAKSNSDATGAGSHARH